MSKVTENGVDCHEHSFSQREVLVFMLIYFESPDGLTREQPQLNHTTNMSDPLVYHQFF